MLLTWNEIRQRAVQFARDWTEGERERAEAQTFWNEFFNVFGISRRKVASFEEPVKNLVGDMQFIDLLWKGRLIAEHKSRGGGLSKAHSQAVGYVQNLINAGRGDEVPRYVIVSDFQRIALHDLEAVEPLSQTRTINLAEFPQLIQAFAFIAGYEVRRIDPEDPANFQAVELLSNLHDQLEAGGYVGHGLERFLVRVLFCLFAEDTGIFEPDAFTFYLENRTQSDGSDLGPQLARLFGVLNTPPEQRQANLDEDLAGLPYVNGELFSEYLGFAEFNSNMRKALLQCCHFQWSRISPAIFGSLFQAVMLPKERRQIGGHYTSEPDILKLIRSLFLDDLWADFERAKKDKSALRKLHDRLAKLHFFDPACGCGNFLVITYRELRRLEIAILRALYGKDLTEGDLRAECRVDVDQMHGIEIEEWPARIAEVAMWLMDHQMNQEVFEAFGAPLKRLPLTKSAKITVGNALRLDWETLLPPENCSYVMGNPPFVGAKFQTAEQRAEMNLVAGGVKNFGLLDYVTGWYFKAAGYIRGTQIRVAFVSTNSITQGEQVGVLWNELFRRGIKIHFGHRTFPWESEAKGKAHVHVVIIGFGPSEIANKYIYDYEADPRQVTVNLVGNISPYLVEGSDRAIQNRTQPLCNVPGIGIGNKPIDDGQYLFTTEEKEQFLRLEPQARDFFRRWVGSDEFINGWERWCLWLGACDPGDLRDMPEVLKRVEAVRRYRLASRSASTQKLAQTPTRFHVENMPKHRYLVIPNVSSEKRIYIPLGFLPPQILASNLLGVIPDAGLFHFGVLSSKMHMAWIRQVCGRLKSDYRYSNKLVYNNFPWPQKHSAKNVAKVEALAQEILDLRIEYGDGRAGFLPARQPKSKSCALADLYDPLFMPLRLYKAHRALDRAVDICYRAPAFDNERQRVEFLFVLYEKLVQPLALTPRKRQKREK